MMALSDMIAGSPTTCCIMRDKEGQNGIKECLLAVTRPFGGFFPGTRVHGRVAIPNISHRPNTDYNKGTMHAPVMLLHHAGTAVGTIPVLYRKLYALVI